MELKGSLHDSRGNRISLKIKKFDTETGLVEFYITDLWGTVLSNSIGAPLEASTYYDAPLSFKASKNFVQAPIFVDLDMLTGFKVNTSNCIGVVQKKIDCPDSDEPEIVHCVR